MNQQKDDRSPGGAEQEQASTFTPDQEDEAVEKAAEEKSDHFRITEGQREALSGSS